MFIANMYFDRTRSGSFLWRVILAKIKDTWSARYTFAEFFFRDTPWPPWLVKYISRTIFGMWINHHLLQTSSLPFPYFSLISKYGGYQMRLMGQFPWICRCFTVVIFISYTCLKMSIVYLPSWCITESAVNSSLDSAGVSMGIFSRF